MVVVEGSDCRQEHRRARCRGVACHMATSRAAARKIDVMSVTGKRERKDRSESSFAVELVSQLDRLRKRALRMVQGAWDA